MILQSECNNKLRTQLALGYIAECFTEIRANIGSFLVFVQSESFIPSTLLKFVNNFLVQSYRELIMSPKFESEFSEAVLVLNTSLAEEEKSLYLLSNRVWDQIIQEKYQFDIKEQKMYQLSKISPQ